jgi:hypothetical protein
MHTLSVGDCISFAWNTFKQRPWILIGALLLSMIIAALPQAFGPHPTVGPDGQVIPPPASTLGTIVAIVSLLVSIGVSLGLTTFSLRAHDNIQAVQIADLWNPAPYWRFFGAHILTVIAIALGFIALIVPGVILAMGLMFVPYLVIDRGLGPIEAMKESWRVTKGHKWQLFFLFLALIGLNILGAIALIIGLLVTVPISMLAAAHAYRTLTS